MGEVIPFPNCPAASADLAVDVLTVMGDRVGAHLTDWNEIALFVEHQGCPVGGMLAFREALMLHTALGDMLMRMGGPPSIGGAA